MCRKWWHCRDAPLEGDPIQPLLTPDLCSDENRSIDPERMKLNRPPVFTRRHFVRQTATALGAVIAAPTIVPSSVFARNGTVPPSERITMGFIGVGTQGGGHLLGGAWTYVAGGYAGRKEVQVLAVCDAWRDRRERACQRVNDNYAAIY